MNRWPLLRDVFLFILGTIGVLHETIIATAPRETLLLLFGGALGLPAFLRADEKRNE